MSLNLGGLATLSSITLSRPGGDDGETLATLKLSIGTKDTEPVCAALGTEAGDALEWAWLASGDGQIRERRYLRLAGADKRIPEVLEQHPVLPGAQS